MARFLFPAWLVVLGLGLGAFSALSAGNSAVCKCNKEQRRTTPPRKAEKFKVHVNELGYKYDEEVEMDVEKGTQRFHVPAHRDYPAADYLFESKTNLTMIRIPTIKACFLLKTAQNVASPRLAMASLDQMSKSHSKVKARTDVSSWVYSDTLVDRYTLSDEMAEFCAKYPITQLKPEESTTSIEEVQGIPRRVRRQSSDCDTNAPPLVCPSGKISYKCQRIVRVCVYMWVKPCYLKFVNDGKSGGKVRKWVCTEQHVIYNVRCCDPYCV